MLPFEYVSPAQLLLPMYVLEKTRSVTAKEQVPETVTFPARNLMFLLLDA